MARKFRTIDERLDYIEFRQQLLFDNTDLSRMLFEYEISKDEYSAIMDLMDSIRNDLDQNKKVSHGAFEDEMYQIVPAHSGDYHMCEYIARAFMDDGRWTEVFPALYGHMPKYSYLWK